MWRYFDHNAISENPRIYLVQDKLTRLGKEKVLFWFGATGNKVLPKILFKEIFDYLNENKISYQLAAGPNDEHLLKKYLLVRKKDTIFLKGSLKDTAKFFKSYQMIIMPDTGPMHLAIALGIPTIQVFVNSDPVWYAYKGENIFLINKKFDSNELSKFMKNHLD